MVGRCALTFPHPHLPVAKRVMLTYSDKLRDPRWQKKRLEVMQRDNWTCLVCGDKKSPLNVHHKRYFPLLDPWEYDISGLETLCEKCHAKHHKIKPKISISEWKKQFRGSGQ